MDSGLGSDEDRRTSSSSNGGGGGGGRTTTKQQKQLHNQRLLSGCFIDASSLTDDGDVAEDDRRRDERRQGALIFQTSIPQFSMLQMSSTASQEENNCAAYPVAPSSSASSVLQQQQQEPNTPFNSIVQLASDVSCKTPLGFYVDLNDVEAEPPAPPSSSTAARKNIFSMVIDFEAPKKDMPSRLSSSLIARRKVRDKKTTNGNNSGSRPLSAASSSSSSLRNGLGNEDGARNSSSSSLCSSSNNAEGNQSASVSDINDVKEKDEQEVKVVDEEEVVVVVVEEKERDETTRATVEKESPAKEPENADTQQFVKLADLERQTPRVEFSFAPKMSRSIPESSWVESPLLMSRSAGYRSAPHPIEPEPSELSDSFTDTSTSQPRKSVQRLGTDLLRMFLEEIGPDVTVEVEGHKLKAHKCILASRCQYFAAMLSGNWLEASGNVISLQGFTYESVYFALCHIYSGAAHVPDSISLVELASLADMLGLEGLKEVVEHALKQRHCHNFHRPCAGCCTGVVEVLPLAAAYGLDELYQKCLAWIRQHFCKVWPSRAFAGLPKELREKCYQQHIIHMIPDTVLDTTIACDKLLAAVPTLRWAEPVIQLANQLSDACHSYMSQHFTSVLSSPSFLALETGLSWNISQAEHCLLAAANLLGPDQACRSYTRCHRMLEQNWTPRFTQMVYKVKLQVEERLIGQAEKVSRCTGWSRMDPMLRSHIKELSRLPLDDPPSTRLPRATTLRSKKYTQTSKQQPHHSITLSSSDSSRNSSPGMNQTQSRLHNSTGSPSLRRSLLLAARTPQVPPSPSTHRRSTLTQPTQSSAAKSAPSKNLKSVVEKKTPPVRKTLQQQQQSVTVSRPVSAATNKRNVQATSTTTKNTQVALNKKPTPPLLRKNEKPTPSLIRKNEKPTPPLIRKTDSRSNSPRLAKQKETPKTQPKRADNVKTTQKPASPKKTTEPPVRKTLQRSDTFLKEEPTVLQKIVT